MTQKFIVGDVVMYDNKIMVIKEQRDGSHIDYTPNGTGHAASRDCVRYWDEEKGAWRQFKAYNFLRVA